MSEKEQVEELKLSESEAMSLALQKERIASAEAAAQLRHAEMQLLVERLVKRAEENGRYRVVSIEANCIKRVEND